jgi:hypothetical protein
MENQIRELVRCAINTIKKRYTGEERTRRALQLKEALSSKTKRIEFCYKIATIVDETIPRQRKIPLNMTIRILLDYFKQSMHLQIDYTGNILEWIHTEIPLTQKLNFGVDVDLMDKFITVSGDVQSGKTRAMRHCMLKNKMTGKKSLLIVRNIKDDVRQFVVGTAIFNQDIQCLGFSGKYQLIPCGLNGLNYWLNPQSNLDTLILLANGHQLYKFNEALKKRPVDFSIFIDEADMVVNSVRTDESDHNLRTQLDHTIKQAKRVLCVTATSLGLFFKEGYQIRTSNILSLPHPPNYKGINSLHFSEIVLEEKNKTIEVFTEHMLKIVKSNDTCVFKNAIDGIEDHPVIILNKTTNLNKDQLGMFHLIMKSKNLRLKWTYIVYNRHGIMIYHHSLKNNIKICNTKPKSNKNGLLCFKNVGIQDGLQYLYDNGGVERFSHIIIAAGFLAARGINYTSRNFKWHLTGEFLVRPKSSFSEDLMQSLRLCGIYKDNIPLTLWTTKDIWRDINKTLTLRQNIISMVIQKNNVLDDALAEHKVLRQEMPKRPISKTKHTFKVIPNVNANISDDELERLGLEKLRMSLARNSSKSTNLRDLINYCSKNPNRLFTSKEIYENTKINYINDFTRWEITNHYRYKILCPTTDGRYRLNPNVHL